MQNDISFVSIDYLFTNIWKFYSHIKYIQNNAYFIMQVKQKQKSII